MRSFVRLFVLCCAVAIGIVFSCQAAGDSQRSGDPQSSTEARSRGEELQVAAADANKAVTKYKPMHLKFRTAAKCKEVCASLKPPIHVFMQKDEFAIWLIELSEGDFIDPAKRTPSDPPGNYPKYLELTKSLDQVGTFELREPENVISIPPPRDGKPSTQAPKASEPIIRGKLKGLTGKGTNVAVIDSGVDYRHPDFRDAAGGSRIKWYWDTQLEYQKGRGQPGPLNYPNGTPIGTLFSRDDLNAILRSGNPNTGPQDFDGHGTACAGVAVGNDSARKSAEAKDARLRDYNYSGVATGADLIAVRIVNDAGLYTGSWLLNAIVRWLDQVAGDSPLVVSCSFGGLGGQYDGARVREQMLNRIVPSTTPGRVLCFAAGNEGDSQRHTTVTVAKDKPAMISWASKSKPSPKEQHPDTIELFVTDAPKNMLSVKPLEGANVHVDDPPFVRGHFNEMGQQLHTTLNITLQSAGNGGVRIESTSDKPLRIDAYMFPPKGSGYRAAVFRDPVNRTQLGEPSSSDTVICIGSYNFNDAFLQPSGLDPDKTSASGEDIIPGEISHYSNAGFVRPFDKYDEVRSMPPRMVKPELVAPGQWHVAAATQHTPSKKLDASGKYKKHNGTSAATPYTAGFIALLMEKNKRLSADDFRTLLKTPGLLTHDDQTGPDTNPQWGYGKLDLNAAGRIIDAWK